MTESKFKIENIHDYFDDFQQSVPEKLQRPVLKYTIIYCMFENHIDHDGRFIQAQIVRDSDHEGWKGHLNLGVRPFDKGYLPRTFGSDVERARKVIHAENANHGITNRDEFRGWVGLHMNNISLQNLDDIVDFNYPCNEEGQKIVKTTRANGKYYDFIIKGKIDAPF